MNLNRNHSCSPKMKRTCATLVAILALNLSTLGALAQKAPEPASSSPDSVKTFYLTNLTQQNDAQEVTTALRNMFDPQVKIYLVPSQNAITMRGTPDELATVQKLLIDLDRTKKLYRLTYTITDIDNGKSIGTQHYAIIVASGGRTTIKQGSKVPIATGTFNGGSSGSQTQFTYLDIGLNIDASLDGYVDGVRLRSKVEQSSLQDDKLVANVVEPIVRQSVLEGTSTLIPGVPLILGSLDVPGTTRHLDIAVVLEVVH
jgi:type II secretory pathway component GspD/PulD (secretin)